MKRLWIALAAVVAIGGCTSPEATRQRGGGPGGDIGNRPTQVKMHEGSRQYWETPVLIPSAGPSLAPAEQARQLSLPGGSQEESSEGQNREGSGGGSRP